MSALNLLKSTQFTQGKPYLGFSKLTNGNHKVYEFRVAKNKQYKSDNKDKNMYKECILVELADQVLFLPGSYTKRFVDEQGNVMQDKINELNKTSLYLYFGGVRANR